MYVKVLFKGGHHAKKGRYYDVCRYFKVDDVREIFKMPKTITGVKTVLGYKIITKQEYLEGLKKQRQDLYIHCNKDNEYRKNYIFQIPVGSEY